MTIKFISLNTILGGLYFEEMANFLRKERPDIVALQEAYNSKDAKLEKRFRTLSVLSQELKLPHAAFAPALLENRGEVRLEWGNGILSRFPLSSEKALFYDVPYQETKKLDAYTQDDAENSPRNLQYATVSIEGAAYHVFNTQGIWGRDPWDNPRRLAMGKKIADMVAGLPRVILCGDFNISANTQTIGYIEKHLKNILKGRFAVSFNMRKIKPYIKNPALIDMIMVSPDIKVISSAMPDADISDHLPQILEFEV